MKRLVALCFLLSLPSLGNTRAAEPLRPLDGPELTTAIEKLATLRTALYVAAHPDDENTAMIAWLANEKLARTGYLSMTRGSGGQNLIGEEVGPLLGVIRTRELIRARQTDGGEQFFSRAIDFGYSKSPDETLAVWDRDEVLSDVVRVIRKFRPDIIITRFPTDGRGTHGHHTASAILAKEAAALSGDPDVFPDQVAELGVWSPERVFWNAWQLDPEEEQSVLTVSLGGYDPQRGLSWGELAALSRSMHKSQGFGASGRRTSFTNDLLLTWGSAPGSDPFDGIDSTWARVPGGESVMPLADAVIDRFDPREPAASLPDLLRLRDAVSALDDGFWKRVKLEELDEIIVSAAGIWAEVTTESVRLIRGASVPANLLVVNRSDSTVTFRGVRSAWGSTEGDTVLRRGEAHEETFELSIPVDAPLTQPYWLRSEPDKGIYSVEDLSLIGEPIAGAVESVTVSLTVDSRLIEPMVPIVQRTTDRVRGEVFTPVVIHPHVSVTVEPPLLVFPDATSTRAAEVVIRNHGGAIRGELAIDLPPEWTTRPESLDLDLAPGAVERATFQIVPAPGTGRFEATVVFASGGNRFTREVRTVAYDHIPETAVFDDSRIVIVREPIEVTPTRIGYVTGSGDAVDDALERIGYDVVPIAPPELPTFDLSTIDTLVFGIRAFNTFPELSESFGRINDWVANGGRVVAQYNTRGRRSSTAIPTPRPIEISRDRVTVEEAPVLLLEPDHPVLRYPNAISTVDFDGWVQERGLYFPNGWDERWTPLLEIADPGEDPTRGSLLVLEHGEGVWIYTGISFFRQLPAGVAGAYRLLSNLVSVEQR